MTGDLKILWEDEAGVGDLAVEGNDLARDPGLRTAVLLSLFLDRRAEDVEALPPGQTDRRGWWADGLVGGMGSRLWLLERAKWSSDTAARARAYAEEALAWLVEDRVAARVTVTEDVPVVEGVVALNIEIERPTGEQVRYRFASVWDAEENR